MSLKIQSKFNEELEKWDFVAAGEVDISTAPQLRELLNGAYQEKKADILIHMDDLTYIDSTGLGVIIGAFGRMQENKNKITLINPKENIKKLLSITSLDRILCSEI
ncbi:STAS domain-containing protein [Sinanaerobacter chloroacetimidivorans]|jgi:anti-sigma B factor antagonist|uniref:Anti-sigma factor antagonist n=1 Tax=Sinanaerobacter chloroacetimidivorans TaxID=2818044 RepID=A0A8J7W103_9FIRM|nr:STAS domain-containing protein [Sinanaerobacter chloroacetimidivorans]MBR0598416.1 STAS domain-containing protein [Sinanaerobacter chloroacetimidivorans]